MVWGGLELKELHFGCISYYNSDIEKNSWIPRSLHEKGKDLRVGFYLRAFNTFNSNSRSENLSLGSREKRIIKIDVTGEGEL